MKKFLTSESGAVTVDWVVLTAGLVGLGFAVGSTILTSINNASSDIATSVDNLTCVWEVDANNVASKNCS